MANFAQLDGAYTVIEVIVVNNATIDNPPVVTPPLPWRA